MKRLTLISISIFLLTNSIFTQDIINETGKDGKFIVRDAEQKEVLIIEDGSVDIKGTLSIDSLSEGSVKDKYVVWSPLDKQFKVVFSKSLDSPYSIPINASVAAADSWTESSGNIYRASGNVGIGTATPFGQFHISHAAIPQLLLEDTGATTNSRVFRLVSAGDLTYFQSRTNDNTGEGAGGNDMMIFDMTNGDVSFHEGNVGIGTVSPSTDLHVLSPTGADGEITIGTTDAGDANSDAKLILAEAGKNKWFLWKIIYL